MFIKPKITTMKNLQSNSPIERLCQVMRHMLLKKLTRGRLLLFGSFWILIFLKTAWAICSSYNNNTNATPAQLVFGRDMMFNLTTFVNWKEL